MVPDARFQIHSNAMNRYPETRRAFAPHQHLVQLYENDADLASLVASYLAPSQRFGAGSLVIATRAHRIAIERALERQAEANQLLLVKDRWMFLDAEETLDAFMVDGEP